MRLTTTDLYISIGFTAVAICIRGIRFQIYNHSNDINFKFKVNYRKIHSSDSELGLFGTSQAANIFSILHSLFSDYLKQIFECSGDYFYSFQIKVNNSHV